jgi:hypothetical protein
MEEMELRMSRNDTNPSETVMSAATGRKSRNLSRKTFLIFIVYRFKRLQDTNFSILDCVFGLFLN